MAGPGFTPVSQGPPSSRGLGAGSASGATNLLHLESSSGRQVREEAQRLRQRPGIKSRARPAAGARTAAVQCFRPKTHSRRLRGRQRRPRRRHPRRPLKARVSLRKARCAYVPAKPSWSRAPTGSQQHAVEDAGPSGPGDRRSLAHAGRGRGLGFRRGGDDDRVLTDRGRLGRERDLRFVLWLPRSASGQLGDQPPRQETRPRAGSRSDS